MTTPGILPSRTERSRDAFSDHLRRGRGLAMVGVLQAIALLALVVRAIPLTTWQNPPWVLVIATSVLTIALWGASFSAFVGGLSSDYTTAGRFFVGLAQSDAPWTLRNARWPAFTVGMALFIAMNRALGAPHDAETFAAQMSLTALAAGVVASWGAPRGLRVDGARVRFDRWLSERSVRVDNIARVSLAAREGALHLHLHDGRVLAVPYERRATSPYTLLAAITAVCEAPQVPPRPPPPEGAEARWAVLDREGRDLATWRTALRRLLEGERGFRAAPVARDDLRRLLADPRTPGGRRLAAALALWETRAHDADTATRIRDAASDADDVRVRVALEDVPAERLDARAVEDAEAAGREAAGREAAGRDVDESTPPGALTR